MNKGDKKNINNMNLCLSKISLVITSVNVLPSFAMDKDKKTTNVFIALNNDDDQLQNGIKIEKDNDINLKLQNQEKKDDIENKQNNNEYNVETVDINEGKELKSGNNDNEEENGQNNKEDNKQNQFNNKYKIMQNGDDDSQNGEMEIQVMGKNNNNIILNDNDNKKNNNNNNNGNNGNNGDNEDDNKNQRTIIRINNNNNGNNGNNGDNEDDNKNQRTIIRINGNNGGNNDKNVENEIGKIFTSMYSTAIKKYLEDRYNNFDQNFKYDPQNTDLEYNFENFLGNFTFVFFEQKEKEKENNELNNKMKNVLKKLEEILDDRGTFYEMYKLFFNSEEILKCKEIENIITKIYGKILETLVERSNNEKLKKNIINCNSLLNIIRSKIQSLFYEINKSIILDLFKHEYYKVNQNKGRKPKETPEEGRKPKETPEEGRKPKETPEEGRKPKETPEEGKNPEGRKPEEGKKPEENKEKKEGKFCCFTTKRLDVVGNQN